MKFKPRPEGASEFYLTQEELNTVTHRDEGGNVVRVSPCRIFTCRGCYDVVYKVEMDKFYYLAGGEPIPLSEIFIKTHFAHVPLNEDQKKQANLELDLIDSEKEKAALVADEVKKEVKPEVVVERVAAPKVAYKPVSRPTASKPVIAPLEDLEKQLKQQVEGSK